MRNLLLRTGVFGGILLVWAALTYSGILHPLIMPKPHETLAKFFLMLFRNELFATRLSEGTSIWPLAAATLWRLVRGLLLGSLIGLPLGILIGVSRNAEKALDPFIGFARAIPITALSIVFMMMFGFVGDTSKIAMVAFASLLLITVGAAEGIRGVISMEVVEAAKLDGASGFDLVRYVIVPLAMPQIYANLRVSYHVGMIVVIVVEQMGAISELGIGAGIYDAMSLFRTSELWAIIAFLGFLGMALDWGMKRLRQILMPWL